MPADFPRTKTKSKCVISCYRQWRTSSYAYAKIYKNRYNVPIFVENIFIIFYLKTPLKANKGDCSDVINIR